MTILTFDHLVCQRGGRDLFAPVNVTLNPGTIVLMKGPNGSGKSTLLRTIAGLHPAAGGKIIHATHPLYIGHAHGAHEMLSVSENLVYWRGMAQRSGTMPIHDILQQMDLTMVADRPAGKLSQGQKRRLTLARLLLEESDLWLLDEPYAGLDHAGLELLKAMIDKHCAQGGAALIACHDDFFHWTEAKVLRLEQALTS